MHVVYKKYCSKTYWLDEITCKWEKLFDRPMSNTETLGYVCNIYKSTTSTKLHSFQYRLMFHTVFMNTILYKWKVVPSRLCTFCGECNESIQHLMWQCYKIQPIWIHVKNIVEKYTRPVELNINLEIVLLSLIHCRSNHVANLIATAIKQTIFGSKCGNTIPTIQQMNYEIEYIKKIELIIVKKHNTIDKHKAKWKDRIYQPSSTNVELDEFINEYIGKCK